MTSYLKIIFTFILAFFIISSVSLATDVNGVNTSEILDGTSGVPNAETNEDTSTNDSNSDYMTIDGQTALNLDDMPESDLGLTNILSIILIAVGIVLILLGIAIIIKIK